MSVHFSYLKFGAFNFKMFPISPQWVGIAQQVNSHAQFAWESNLCQQDKKKLQN